MKTIHQRKNSLFHFVQPEKVAIPLLFLGGTLFVALLWIMNQLASDYYASQGGTGLENDSTSSLLILIVFGLFAYLAPLVFLFLAYKRAKFLKNGGYCLITPTHIEATCGDRTRKYEYHNRTIKTKTWKDGSTDIYIGKSFKDALKHSGFIVFSKSYFRAIAALVGFGAPLYRITNSGEVINALKANTPEK